MQLNLYTKGPQWGFFLLGLYIFWQDEDHQTKSSVE